jgi:RNase H-like domain found in reverse transcriptase
LKKAMVSEPILRHFNPELDCEIHTDGSLKGISAVLIQKTTTDEFVVAYSSKSLSKGQKNYAATQLELLAVVWGVEK